MKIKERPYTYLEFCQMIQPPFKVLCFLTLDDSWAPPESIINLEYIFKKHRFSMESMGEMRKLTCIWVDPITENRIPVVYYAYLNPKTKLLSCFTDAPSDQIEKTIGAIADEPGVYNLWIGPTAMEEIKDEIISKYPYSDITTFTAKRTSSYIFKGKIRPDFDRTIVYYGKDGLKTLEEAKYYYGAFPTDILFDVPAVMRFRVNAKGAFSLEFGNKEYFFDIFNNTLEIVQNIRKTVESSRFELTTVQMERKELKVPFLVPWEIEFSKELEYPDAEVLVNKLQENGFTLYNYILSKGSVLLDSNIIDEVKKCMFSISMGSSRMVVVPRHYIHFDSFLRFFQTIVEDLDPQAKCHVGREG